MDDIHSPVDTKTVQLRHESEEGDMTVGQIHHIPDNMDNTEDALTVT
jgi:hypothetical protein